MSSEPRVETLRFIINLKSGRGRGKKCLARLRTLESSMGLEIRVPQSARELAGECSQAARDRLERVCVAGGDGTLHHAVQALAGTGCALGILPVGSCNDLALALDLPSELDGAIDRFTHGRPRTVDLGKVEDRYFAGIGGVGIDGEVARMVNEDVRWLPGPVAFVYAAVRTLFRFKPPTVTVEHDGGRFHGPAYFAVLANSTRFGGGMKIAPDALLDDGLFDLVIVHRTSRLQLFRAFPKVYSGKHKNHPAVEIHRTGSATVCCDRNLKVYADGEPMMPVGEQAVRFQVVPGALKVIV